MKPVEFPEQNDVLKPHPGTEEWVSPLPIHRQRPDGVNDALVLSCWEPTEEELAEIIQTRKVYIICHGFTHAPLSITGAYPWKK